MNKKFACPFKIEVLTPVIEVSWCAIACIPYKLGRLCVVSPAIYNSFHFARSFSIWLSQVSLLLSRLVFRQPFFYSLPSLLLLGNCSCFQLSLGQSLR